MHYIEYMETFNGTAQQFEAMFTTLNDVFSTTESLNITIDEVGLPFVQNHDVDTQSLGLFYAVFSLIFTIGIVGNSILVLIFIRHKSMRTIPNTYIFSLAVADLLTTLNCASAPLVEMTSHDYPIICKVFQVVMETSFAVTSYTLTALSIERYYVIAHPLGRKISTRKYTFVIVGTIWLVGITYSCGKIFVLNPFSDCVQMYVPSSFANAYTIIDFIALYLIPLVIIADFYILMAHELYFSDRSLKEGACVPGSAASRRMKTRKRVALTVLILVAMFAIFYLPFNYMSLRLHFDSEFRKNKNWGTITRLLFCIGCLHNSFNPYILYFLSKSIRCHFNNYLFYCIIGTPIIGENEITLPNSSNKNFSNSKSVRSIFSQKC